MKYVAELLPNAENTRDVCVGAEMKVCLPHMELLLLKHKEASFNRAMSAVTKEPPAVRVECVTLRWNWNKVFSKLKVLETDLGESLKVLSELTTQNFLTMSK